MAESSNVTSRQVNGGGSEPSSRRPPAWQKGLIVSGFAAIGKSTVSTASPTIEDYRVIDLDSSLFSKLPNGERNPRFVEEYMASIIDQAKQPCIILVSAHEELRSAIADQGLYFFGIAPLRDCKAEYIERMRKRGTPGLIPIFERDWDKFIDSSEKEVGDIRCTLRAGEYLSASELRRMLRLFLSG